MPCYTDPPTKEELNSIGHMVAGQLEAVLCGLLTTHGAALLDKLNYAEIGVSEDLVRRWWRVHQYKDKLRREREIADARKYATAKKARAKLTPAERDALGLNDD